MKLTKRVMTSLVLAVMLMLTACSSPTSSSSQKAPEVSEQSADATKPVSLDFFYYDGLRVFKADSPIWQQVQKDTNVTLKGVAPTTPGGDATEQFNLVLASGDIPDIIHASKSNIMKNSSKLVQPLEDLIAEHAPNLNKYLEENPIVKAAATGTDGHICFIPFIRDGSVSEVMFIRKDWLDKYNLPIPKTTEEYENALRTFREQDANGNNKKDEIGFFDRDNLYGIPAVFNLYGTALTPYIEDDVVKDDRYTEKFKEAVKNVARIYEEGLIDPEIFTRGKDARDIMFQQNIGASTVDWIASTAAYQTKYEGEIPGLEWVPILPPADESGKSMTEYSRDLLSGWGWSISKNCSDPVAAIKLFDYFFTEEGRRLMNFGIEGETYDMVDGQPIFKESVLKGEKPVVDQLEDIGYLQIGYKQDFEYERQWTDDLALVGVDEYMKAQPFLKTVGSLSLSYTGEELEFLSKKQPALASYIDEMIQKWVLGSEDIDASFDGYLKKIEELGASEVLAVHQAAYDRSKQ